MNNKVEENKSFKLDISFNEAMKRFANVNSKELIEPDTTNNRAFPFVKWVGGKRSIIQELVNRLPPNIDNYYEAFVGGGALFFEISDKIKSAYLNDNNIDLVITYQVIKKHPKELIELLKVHEKKHNSEYYYKIRSQYNLQNPIEVAARLLYLNKTCFNGLYRVNKNGEFNVPVGKYKNPNIIQEKNILVCNKILQNTVIRYGDFSKIYPQKNSFIYLDPPYHPLNETSSFTNYTKLDFTEQDQIRLRDFVLLLHNKGVNIMLSNSDTPFIHDLYNDSVFNVNIIKTPRYINCKPNKRNPVKEVLITNY